MLGDLRTIRGTSRMVVLELDDRCREPRLRGRVVDVSPTGVLFTVRPTVGPLAKRDVDVPLECVRAWTTAEFGRRAGELRSAA